MYSVVGANPKTASEESMLLSNTGLQKIKNYKNATVFSHLNNKTV